MGLKILLPFLLLSYITNKITLEKGLEQTEITLTDIHSFSQVLVEAEFTYIDSDRYEKIHVVARASNRHKKQAYMDLIKKFNAIVRTLIKIKAIPNKEAMIQSIVHRNFLKKSRKWEFSRYFILYGLKEDMARIQQRLQPFRLEVVKTAPVIHYLDQKFISIAAFIEAKLELQRFIKEHLNNEYKILLTKDIEIIGDRVANEQIIQDQIQKEFNSVDESLSEQVKAAQEIEGFYSNGRKNLPKKIIMKVLFQLVEKNADVEDILESIQQGDIESQSISDFEDEMKNQEWKDGEGEDERDGEGEIGEEGKSGVDQL